MSDSVKVRGPARNRDGVGSVEVLPSGRFKVRVWVDGTRRGGTHATREEADQERASLAALSARKKVRASRVVAPSARLLFFVDAGEYVTARVFQKRHNARHYKDDRGAIGGRFSYQFTLTSFGEIVTVHCACGESAVLRSP